MRYRSFGFGCVPDTQEPGHVGLKLEDIELAQPLRPSGRTSMQPSLQCHESCASSLCPSKTPHHIHDRRDDTPKLSLRFQPCSLDPSCDTHCLDFPTNPESCRNMKEGPQTEQSSSIDS